MHDYEQRCPEAAAGKHAGNRQGEWLRGVFFMIKICRRRHKMVLTNIGYTL
jgi:hypothetical protein